MEDDTLGSMADLLRRVARVDAATPTAPVLDRIPDDDFVVERELARGGMGRVLVARQRRLERVVAVKELLTRDPETEARFVREAKITASLQHPAIIPVHDVGRGSDGEPFYAMKLVEGEPLGKRLGRGLPLAERLALLPTVLTVAEGMAYAHSRGVVHRDLKPGNILCGAFGETLIIDWGLAKVLAGSGVEDTLESAVNTSLPPTAFGDRSASTLAEQKVPMAALLGDGKTRRGAVLGTPDFMPPEQANGLAVDERADVYALGAILYYVLTDRMPYHEAQPLDGDAVLQRVRKGPPRPLRERQPGLPPELAALVEKAMARDRRDRYPSARELAADLALFLTGQLVDAHRYSRWQLFRRWLRRHRLPVLFGLITIFTIAAVGTVSVHRVVVAGRHAAEERDRAERFSAAAADRYEDLLVTQARSHFERDPTATLAWLARLDPGSQRLAQVLQLAGDAERRGVASKILQTDARDLFFRSDGTLVTGSSDGVIRAHPRVGPATELGRVEGPVSQLVALPDGGLVVAAKGLSYAAPHQPFVSLSSNPPTVIASDDKNGIVVTADEHGTLQRYVLPAGVLGSAIQTHTPVLALAVTARTIWVRSQDRVRRFETGFETGSELHAEKPVPHAALPGRGGLAVSGDLLVAGGTKLLRIWDLRHGTSRDLPVGGDVVAVSLSVGENGAADRVAASASDGTVIIWNLATGVATQLSHQGQPAHDLRFCPDNRTLLAGRGSVLRVWGASNEVKKLRGHSDDIQRTACAPDSATLASASLDGTVRIWPAASRVVPSDPKTLATWLRAMTDVRVDDRGAVLPDPR